MKRERGKRTITRKVSFRSVHLAVRYKTLHFPVDPVELAQIVPEAGYVVADRDLLSVPFGARVSMSGALATKGDAELRVNSERCILAIRGRDPDPVVDEFETVEHLLAERFEFDSRSASVFYELLAELTVASAESPLAVMARQFRGVAVLNRLGEVLGFPVSNFALRAVGAGQDPGDNNWSEVRIEPSIPDSTRRFFVSIVFRNEQRDVVVEFARSLARTVSRLVEEIERP